MESSVSYEQFRAELSQLGFAFVQLGREFYFADLSRPGCGRVAAALDARGRIDLAASLANVRASRALTDHAAAALTSLQPQARRVAMGARR